MSIDSDQDEVVIDRQNSPTKLEAENQHRSQTHLSPYASDPFNIDSAHSLHQTVTVSKKSLSESASVDLRRDPTFEMTEVAKVTGAYSEE